ncbi:hypothetical protein [Maridesulfovibrio sp.]|uniref:hypothetical protein n=1 Tax=Maridesulfovibrio sp. TaxID=2795000 RepID=UPI002A18B4AA|nr:hypothetical protein [Maridesulfovibrio sp.]
MEEMKMTGETPAGGMTGMQSQPDAENSASMSGQQQSQGTQAVYGTMGSAPMQGGLYQYVPGSGFFQVQPQSSQSVQGVAGTQQGYAAQAVSQQPYAAYGSQETMSAAQPSAAYGAQESMAASQASTAYGTQAAGAMDGAAQSGMYGQAMPEGTQPKFDQNKLGQMYGVMTDVMNGEADPAKIMSLLQDSGADFWKGAVVGAVGALLIGNATVRGAVAGAFGSMFGESDPEGPQVTVGGTAED